MAIGNPGRAGKGSKLNPLAINNPIPPLKDSAVILLGHGTTQNRDSERAVLLQADLLRSRGIAGGVHAAFWKQAPFLLDVLEAIPSDHVYIVPMFISEGYFSTQVIPRELGIQTRAGMFQPLVSGDRTIIYTQPIGTHASMTNIVLFRAGEVLRESSPPAAPPPEETTLFIAGHGTGRNANSRRSVEHQVGILRELRKYAGVHAIFMEEEPFIKDFTMLCGTPYAVVVPYFISDGLHVQEDIPVLMGEPAAIVRERIAAGLPTWRNPTQMGDKLVWYSSSVGTHPAIGGVILERISEASALGPA